MIGQFARRVVRGVYRRIYSVVVHDPPLVAIHIRGPGDKQLHLRFQRQANIALVRQSVCLQLSAAPQDLDLYQGGRRLADVDVIGDLASSGVVSLEIRPVRKPAPHQSRFGFIWNGLSLDPFASRSVSDFTIEKTRSFMSQNAAESGVRIRHIREVLEALSPPDNQLISMTFNGAFAPLFRNWVESTRKHEIPVQDRCMVFPMDDESARIAEREGFHFYYDPGSEFVASIGTSQIYGDGEFTRHMFYQNAVIRDLLSSGVDLLFQDVDVVWFKDPLPLLREYAGHVQFMFDGATSRHGPLCANTGFMYFRNAQPTLDFWEVVFRRTEQVFSYRSQQEPLNKILGLLAAHGLDVDILDERRFVNGHLLPGDVRRSLPEDPYVFHCSWTRNLEAKYTKYKTYGIWYLDDADMIPARDPR